MGEVLALRLDEGTAAALSREEERAGRRLSQVREVGELLAALEKGADRVEALVIGTAETEPISAAQRAYAVTPRLPVLLLTEPERDSALRQTLLVTPFIHRDTLCVLASDVAAVARALDSLVARARQQRSLQAVLATANQQLAEAPAPAAPGPSPELYGHVMDLAPVGLVVTDEELRVRAWNVRAGALLRHSEREVLGRVLPDVVPASARTALRRLLEEAERSAGQERTGVLEVEEGGRRCVLDATIAHVGRRTQERGVLLLLHDITERTRLVQALQEAVRARDEFLSVAAHELRTPVTALRLQVQGLARARGESQLPEPLAHKLRLLDRGIKRLVELIDNLLDVSRLGRGTLELVREPVDLRALADAVAAQLGAQAAQLASTLHVEGPARLVGSWDRLRLEQVLTNLVGNALKFGAGKPVELQLEGRGDRALLRVIDRGPGVAPEDQQRIFERFTRAAPLRHYGGLGLGLWISRQVVEAHGGHIRLTSAPGAGATFEVELPCGGLDEDASGSPE